MEIPVAITNENKTLNAKLSISDTDYGLICLTYQISAFVYAIALIVYALNTVRKYCHLSQAMQKLTRLNGIAIPKLSHVLSI